MWRLIGMKEGKKKGGRGLRKERSLIDLKPKDGKSLAPLTVFFVSFKPTLGPRWGLVLVVLKGVFKQNSAVCGRSNRDWLCPHTGEEAADKKLRPSPRRFQEAAAH